MKKIVSLLCAVSVVLTNAAQLNAKAEEFIVGDVNSDGNYNIADLVKTSKFILKSDELDSNAKIAADVNSDEKINAIDVVNMRQQLTGINYSVNISDKVTPVNITSDKNVTDEFSTSQNNFTVNLFKNENSQNEESNIVISPYSAMEALAMTANGADGNTKAEMENTFGMSIDKLNNGYYNYVNYNSQYSGNYGVFKNSNAIWYRNDIDLKDNFVQTNKTYYNAPIFKAPFNSSTTNEINNWVKFNTLNMIYPLVSDDDIVGRSMALVNAVAFNDRWADPFTESENTTISFKSYSGKTTEKKCLTSTENYYMKNDNAEGFLKFYKGGRYAFAAILPNEGIDINSYISGLTVDDFSKMTQITDDSYNSVGVEFPEFEVDYKNSFVNSLKNMGINDAFDYDKADFSKMSDTNQCISDVIQSSKIIVNKDGTKAAAATAVIVNDSAQLLHKNKLIFDRPFVYAIVDTENNVPLFIGTYKE